MKARKIEQETMNNSIPKVLSEEEQGWGFCNQMEEVENKTLLMKWHSNVPGSNAEEHVVIAAIQDTENMGYDVSKAEELIPLGQKYYDQNNLSGLIGVISQILYELNNAPINSDSPYWNYKIYNSFNEIKEVVKFKKYPFDYDNKDFLEKTYRGWIAQICGGALGTAIEGYKTDNLRKAFGEIYSYVRKPNTFNDDITYELAFLKALDIAGKDITSKDIAVQWVSLVPTGWSAEEIALENIKMGIMPPQSGYLNNPYREWIGAQMRGAVIGMVAPGDTEKAARLAYMDGVVSHHNNGVFGEIFNALLTSLAYVKSDIIEIIKEAHSYIPNNCEYYSVIDFAIKSCIESSTWEEAWNKCEKKYGIYNWIHAYPNAAAEVIALWFCKDDFDELMHIVAMEGYDVDCNGAQIATVLVIAKNCEINKKWADPIGDILYTYMRDIKQLSIKELTKKTVELAKKIK